MAPVNEFREDLSCEKPLNVYGYSTMQFRPVRAPLECPHVKSQVVGFRYFNVYGPREQHKGKMHLWLYHLHQQIKAAKSPKLFEGWTVYSDGRRSNVISCNVGECV